MTEEHYLAVKKKLLPYIRRYIKYDRLHTTIWRIRTVDSTVISQKSQDTMNDKYSKARELLHVMAFNEFGPSFTIQQVLYQLDRMILEVERTNA